jgi:hypothetical protein
MRTTEPTTLTTTWTTTWPRSFATIARGVGLAACIVSVCLAAGAARAEDARDGDELGERFTRAFSLDKLGNLTGLKKDDEAKAGIEYRERSPLVVPRSRDLPPPETGDTGAKVANWPRDPAANRKTTTGRSPIATQQPGTSDLPEKKGGLGIDMSAFSLSNMFGKPKPESKPFQSEPARESLTQPPSGYQTPSPDFAYGTGPAPSQPAANSLAGSAVPAATAPKQ